MKEKKQLLRVVRSKEGEISVDAVGKAPGRGAYLCKKAECLRKARKASRLEHSLECSIPDDVYAALEKELTV
jgi:predicted RNA-binding protein YlxR (DUF448 family)